MSQFKLRVTFLWLEITFHVNKLFLTLLFLKVLIYLCIYYRVVIQSEVSQIKDMSSFVQAVKVQATNVILKAKVLT